MTEFAITRKLNHYRRQLMLLYRGTNELLLEDIVSQSPIYITEENSFDNWNGGTFGHALTFYLKDELYARVGGLDGLSTIANKLRDDFNRVSASIENEIIDAVSIELFNPDDDECQAATQPNGITSLNGEHISLWKSGYLKLFISHRDAHKKEVSELAEYLLPYGISSFVAHTDIVPTDEWRHEIEKALRSMDVFLAYLTDDFSGGDWTNQEVGFAIARGVPIIPLKMPSKDPYGFMSIYQGLPGAPNNPTETAKRVFKLICHKLDGRNIVRQATISAFVHSTSFIDTMAAFDRLQDITQFTDDDLERLVSGFNNNNQLYGCAGINARNRFLNFVQARSNNAYETKNYKIIRKTEEIPF